MLLFSSFFKSHLIPGKLTKYRWWNRRKPFASYTTQVKPIEEDSLDSNIDSDPKKYISPLQHVDFFNLHDLFTMNDLFEARVHYGHKEGSLNDYMRPHIFGSRLGHLIFDLNQTADHLRLALNIAAHIAYRGGIILFIGQFPQHSYLIETTARECGEFAHTRFFRHGLFSNSSVVFGATTRLPDLCIFLNSLSTVLEQHRGIAEAAKLAIPSIAIMDSNCDPRLVTYPIPGNDDSPSCVELYCKLFKTAILRGKERRSQDFQETSVKKKVIQS